MTLAGGLVIYFCLWWVVLFGVLPWGIRVSDTPQKGHAASAPDNPRILLKFGITTVVSALLWCVVWAFMR